MAYLTLENYTKTLGEEHLEGISFFLEKGERLLLLGESRLLIRGILGHFPPQSGEILWEKTGEWGELAVVLGDCFYPKGIRPKEIGHFFSLFYPQWKEQTFHSYLEDLNLSPKHKLEEPWDLFRCAMAVGLTQNPSLFLYDPPVGDFSPEEAKQWADSLAHCARVLGRESCGKIFTASELEEFPFWEELHKVGILQQGKLLVFGEIGEIEQNYAIISCTLEEIQQIAPKDYLWKKQDGTNFQLLIKDRFLFFTQYPKFPMTTLSFSEIFAFLQES